jgi:hypothetical protein
MCTRALSAFFSTVGTKVAHAPFSHHFPPARSVEDRLQDKGSFDASNDRLMHTERMKEDTGRGGGWQSGASQIAGVRDDCLLFMRVFTLLATFLACNITAHNVITDIRQGHPKGGSGNDGGKNLQRWDRVWRLRGTASCVPSVVGCDVVLLLRGGGEGDEYGLPTEYGLRSANRDSLGLNTEKKEDNMKEQHELRRRQDDALASMGKGAGVQSELAEEYLRQLPSGLSDWRHSFKATQESTAFNLTSAFKTKHSFEQRVEMAARIQASGKGVPVIAERLHDGIRLPNTLKPKFSVPAALPLDKFVSILHEKLPWSDLYSRHSHIR